MHREVDSLYLFLRVKMPLLCFAAYCFANTASFASLARYEASEARLNPMCPKGTKSARKGARILFKQTILKFHLDRHSAKAAFRSRPSPSGKFKNSRLAPRSHRVLSGFNSLAAIPRQTTAKGQTHEQQIPQPPRLYRQHPQSRGREIVTVQPSAEVRQRNL
jgi:hypothetical protein